jgi:hypothetical protein
MLSDPLSYAMLSDADPSVREAAAEALGMYIGVPAARAALAYAADNDTAAEVRLTSRLASMNRNDVAGFVHATLLDQSLAPAERIAPLVQAFSRDLDGGRSQIYGPAYTEKARALIEIVMASDDYAVKTQGFDQLQQVVEQSYASGDMGPELVDLLTESRLVDDMQTRTRMLRLLSNLSSVPEVRSRLDEIAEQNPELVETMPFYFMDQNTSDLVPGLGRASL